jgi:MFS family permease
MERTLAQRHFFLLIAVVGGLAILSSTMSKTPVLPLFARELGATPEEIGWIVIASTLPGILISFPAGAIADFFGKRRVIIASLLVFATAPFFYLFVADTWQLMAVRFYHGFATAIFGTVATAAIAERYPDRRAAMLSTYSSVTIVGRSIAPFLGGFLISVANFNSVYVACAISGVIAWIAGTMLPREQQAHSDQKPAFPQFFGALRTVFYGAIEAFLALYAASLGIPAWQVGVILGVQLVSVVAIKPVMGVLSDRFGRETIILPGIVLGTISVGLLPRGTDVFVLSLLSLVYGIAFAAVTSSTSALVADLSKRGQFGASIGVLRTIMDVGQTIGPVLTGFVVGSLGYPVAFPVLATVLALSAVLFIFTPRPALVP